ncbi:unnamed protein product [Brassica rapa subsp. trilocularis]
MGEEANKQVRVGWVSFNLHFIDGDGMNNRRNSQKVIRLSFNWLQKENRVIVYYYRKPWNWFNQTRFNIS